MTMTMHPTKTDRLAGIELFTGANQADLECVAERCVELQVSAGRELCREGERAREFVVILEGEALVTIGGRETAHLGRGSCFGEMALIDGRKRTATVTARTAMRVLVFGGDDFRALLEEFPSFSFRILTLVVGRLRLANSQLSERAGFVNRSPSQWSIPARSANVGAS